MTPEQFHESIWQALKPISKAEFHVVASRPSALESIANLEAFTGIAIPEYFLAFSQKTNGLCIMAKEELWPEPKLFDVGPAWTFYCGVVILGLETDDLPDWASIRVAYEQLVERFGVTDVLPLLKIYGDSNHCWGVRKDGVFVEVFDDEVTVIEKDFPEIYSHEIQGLVQRLNDMVKRINERG
ncbi:TPA: SMI1/KNR4 family protein [Providencia alcalifaciens]